MGKLLDNSLFKGMRAAAEAIQAVVLIFSMASGLAAFVWVAVVRGGLRRDVALTVLIAAVVWFITVAVFWIFVRSWWNPTFYRILELRGELLVEAVGNHHRYTNTKVQKIEARGEVRLVEFRTHWTGRGRNGKMKIKALYDHVLLDGRQIEEDYRTYRWVYPRRPIAPKQVECVGIQQVHEDDLDRQQPYYRDGGGRYRTEHLVVITRFPLAEEPASVEGFVWNSHRPTGRNRLVGQVAHVRQVNAEAGTVDYVVTVRRPRRHHSYGVRWRWPEQ